MCIFSAGTFVPHVDVADTRIFARLTGNGTQILVDEMSYAAAGDLAMILPLPVASRNEDTAVRFVDMSAEPKFFDHLADLVWLWEEERRSFGDELASSESTPIKPPLKVHEVGAFDASFVPSLADFDRLDARFKLPDSVWAGLPQYQDYGFAVFKLRETGKALKGVHPMAFEFSTRLTSTVFVPTVHVHDGQVHPQAWFDHIVYLQGQVSSVNGKFYEHTRYWNEYHYCEGVQLAEDAKHREFLAHNRIEGWKLNRSGRPEADRFGVVRWTPPSSDLPVGEGVVRRWMELASGDLTIKDRYVSWTDLISEVYPKLLPGCFERVSKTDIHEGSAIFPPYPDPDVNAYLLIKVDQKEFYRRIAELKGLDREILLDFQRFLGYAPLLNLDSPLYAVGMSGLLPNTDTLIGVA